MLQDFYEGKKVLITGHTGFKGSWMCQILLNCGAKVCGIALEPNTEPALFNLLNLSSKIESHIIDVRDYKAMSNVFNEFQPEIVIHLAAQPLVIDSYKDPKYTYDVNMMGTVNINECVRLSKSVKSFINVTTDKVYENIEQEGHKYVETDRLNGYDPYSNSKSCSELITQTYMRCFFKEQDIAVSTCRAGNVIGGGDFSMNRIVPDCVKYTMNHEAICLRNPNSVRPYQHVLEADMFYLLLAMKQYEDKEYAGHYNIGPNDEDCVTTGTICKLFCEAWGSDAKWTATNYNGPHEANFLQLDSTKARETLNWQPKWHIQKAIEETVEWSKVFENNGDLEEITNKQINEYLSK